MAVVEADISISVDGFVARPNTDHYPGLGQGGEILHAWLGEPGGEKIAADTFASSGAVLASRAIYDGPEAGVRSHRSGCRSLWSPTARTSR